MATLQPYQSILVKYHDSLVTEIHTDHVVPLLFVSHVLTQREIDDIDIGRTWKERAESLLDVLHYKGERGFREFCNALEDAYPHLATKLRENKPQVEVSDSESQKSFSRDSHVYSVPHKDKTRSIERSRGDFEKRQEPDRQGTASIRSQPEFQEMRGDQISYDKRSYQGSRESNRYYDGGKYEDRQEFISNQVEHDRSSQGSSERGFRRSATDLDVQPGPGEQEIIEKKTIVLEKAHANQSFGMAVSGGRGNPHKVTGDPSIVVSEVIPNSPAAGLLKPGDIICQVNDIDVENAMHGTAVQALKDSGNSARLVIKRRKIVPVSTRKELSPKRDAQQMTLIRDKAKGYGFSLAHHLYIKEIDEKGVAANDGGIRPGDILLKINDRRTDELTLRAAIDLVRNSKDRLDLVILKQDKSAPPYYSSHSLPASYRQKEKARELQNGYDEEKAPEVPSRHYDEEDMKPSRPPPPDEESEKDIPFAGASWKRPGLSSEPQDSYDRRPHDEPLQVHVPADVTLASPMPEPWNRSLSVTKTSVSNVESGPSTPQSSMEGRKSVQYRGDGRLITFRKEGSLGIQVQGGNKVGIFVAAVREGSPAYEKGLREGDQILVANDIDLKDITREEAVLILLSLGEEVTLWVQHKKGAFEKISKEPGDDFYIKAHFSYEASKPEELSFEKESVFHVTDTMYNGVIGSWHAKLIDRVINMERESGVIPNKCRAEQLAVVEQKKEEKTPQKTSTSSLRRSKRGSLSRSYKFRSSDNLDKLAFDTTVRQIELPAYERVQRKRPDFVRPVVLLGPIADITRDKLLQDMPDVYAVPNTYNFGGGSGKSQKRSYNFRDIKDIVDSGKHCLLDISPEEVERLNYAQLYPIVIFLKPPSKQMVKEMRAQYGQSNKHIKQLYDNSVKLEEFYFNTFHAKISCNMMDNWYGRVKEEISKQQQEPVWITEDKVEDYEHDDMVFRGPDRYSQVFDNESSHYDSAPDSPTIRSFASNQPVDEDVVHVIDAAPVQSGPRDDRNMRPSYPEPYISYNGQDAGRHDDRGQDRYDREMGYINGQLSYERDDSIEKASRPGYKPQGHPIKVLPTSEEPREVRQSLRKSLPPQDPPDAGLRRSEPMARLNQPNELQDEVLNKRGTLRKVEDDSDLFRDIDERAGCNVSQLWTIDNESRSRSRRPEVEPSVSASVRDDKDDYDLKMRLEELDNIAMQQPKAREPPVTKPKPLQVRNKIIYQDNQREEVAHTRSYPVRAIPKTHYFAREEPEVRARESVPVSSAPYYQSTLREYQDDEVIPVGRVDNRVESRPSDPPRTYRAEVTIPTTRDTRPERPRSGYNITAKPYNPPGYQISRSQDDSYYSGRKRDGDRYGGDRYGGVTNLDNMDNGRDDPSVVTSDFESLDDDTQVVATARGRFTWKGGVLSAPESGVSIVIPEGAIPKGEEQEIYFKVCKDNNFMPPLDADKGETLLSPLVMCGPHGTQFLKPVELRLPHCASMAPDGWSFSIKSSDTPGGSYGNQPPQLKNLSLHGQDPKLDQCKVDTNSVSVLVDHF